jgi:serpin B
MRRVVLAAWILVLMNGTARSDKMESKVDADARFAAALHGRLRTQHGNLFYSPASVRIAMAMAAAGARGDTEKQMNGALGLSSGSTTALTRQLADWAELGKLQLGAQQTDPQMQKWQEQAAERRRVVLRMANRLWGQTGYHFRDEFLKVLRDGFVAELGVLDFKKDAETARKTINKWVADATEQKIRELIGSGQLTSESKLVLTNAIYFKAQWSKHFEPSATHPQPFYVASDKKVNVPLMNQVDFVQLARFDGGMLAELPYGTGRIVMDVILPTARDGIGRVEEAYAQGALAKWIAALVPARVDLSLPKFRTESSFNLGAQLSALGMPRAFKYGDADFSGMDGGHELYLGVVIHKAFVDVDEHGTEAAAATAVVMESAAMEPIDKPVEFRADHPFLFLVRDRTNGSVLFVGRLSDPSAK